MSKFRWNLSNLFKGEFIKAKEIGWDYAPTWFSITTPISYLITGVCGLFFLMVTFFKDPRAYFSDPVKKCNLIFILCFVLPLLAVIFLKSVLYDSWRQLYFVYASFVMLIIFVLHRLLATKFKKIVVGTAVICFIIVAGFMIRNMPLQHLYFNYFVTRHTEPEYIRKHYEMDYWGTSYKQALEYILENDRAPEIKIYPENPCGENNFKLLGREQKQRLRIVPLTEATYFITNYRWHPDDYPYEKTLVHSFKVLNSSVIDIYKLKDAAIR